jgi:hypothetical protein
LVRKTPGLSRFPTVGMAYILPSGIGCYLKVRKDIVVPVAIVIY